MVRVVGFSGLPVQDGIGLRLPVFDDGLNATETPELNLMENSGLVTRLPVRWKVIENGLVLYAMESFLNPRYMFLLPLGEGFVSMPHGDELLFAKYVRREAGFDILRKFAEQLINDAWQYLARTERSEFDINRSLSSSMRAGSCALLEASASLRLEAFALIAICQSLLGLSPNRIFEDAELDFSDEQLKKLRVLYNNFIEPTTDTVKI